MSITNRVSPELRQGFLELPPLRLPYDLVAARLLPAKSSSASEAVLTEERHVEVHENCSVRIKLYRPLSERERKLPALLWIHGGGYVLGHPEGEDAVCETFVEQTGCLVVSPDYRLAPEHPYPAAIDDCYATLVWLAANAAGLGIDPKRIAIGGASAGGGLAASLALLARDRGGPEICFQMPLYPMIDDRCETPSSREITDSRVWNTDNNIAAWHMYLGERDVHGEVSPYAAPSRADDLTGLPPMYTCVGQLDPFRDETIQYVARLAQAGVDVEFHLYPGGYHAFEHVVPEAEISRRTKAGYVDALFRAFEANKE